MFHLLPPPYNDSGTKNEDVGNIKGANTHKKYLDTEYRKDWFEWQCEVIDEMLRVSKKLDIYNVQGLIKNRANIYKIIGKYANQIHDIVIWYKPNGAPTSTPNKISNTYEYLILLKPKGVKGVDVQSRFYRNVIIKNVKEFTAPRRYSFRSILWRCNNLRKLHRTKSPLYWIRIK